MGSGCVAVRKRRHLYVLSGARAELTALAVRGRALRSLAVEGEDPAAVLGFVRRLGLPLGREHQLSPPAAAASPMADPRLPARRALAALLLAGCGGRQSALAPAGPEAAAVAELFLVMTIAGALIWLAVVAAYLHARRARRRVWSEAAAGRLILWGGALLPAAALLALLGYALWLMPALRPWAAAAAPELRIEVVGHQYWWEVTYRPGGADAVRSANEVRLPAGRRVEVALVGRDVIHSFWIPPLAGKMDMIPGRTNRLTLTADRPGAYRGACAEYCGTSHALMAFDVVVMEPAAFDAWLADAGARPPPRRRAPASTSSSRAAAAPATPSAAPRRRAGSAPTSRTSAAGRRSPPGPCRAPPETIARFVAAPDRVKPGVTMPGFAMLPPDELATLAAWLDGLR